MTTELGRELAGFGGQRITEGHEDAAILLVERQEAMFAVPFQRAFGEQRLIESRELRLDVGQAELVTQRFGQPVWVDEAMLDEDLAEFFLRGVVSFCKLSAASRSVFWR